ncbi:uncharacterized protein LOC119177206 [Rhipicephalus microplus]|uniref:uncharacterized protein LOC119177206 n=1 Tax=Rhipicephalus microplus TaxID=6941 RepID=UPI003F6BCD7B
MSRRPTLQLLLGATLSGEHLPEQPAKLTRSTAATEEAAGAAALQRLRRYLAPDHPPGTTHGGWDIPHQRGDTPPPVTGLCSTCNCRADLNHLCWECPVYNPPRLRALATIKRGPWPSSLRTWACPEPSPPDRAIEFWRALIMFLQDPAAPPVGDRLRDSHKIQAIQAAPT